MGNSVCTHVRKNSHAVVEDTGNLAKHGTDPLGTLRDLNVEELLDGTGVAELVGHHRDIVESVKVREGLGVGLVFDELLGTSVEQTDVRLQASKARKWERRVS